MKESETKSRASSVDIQSATSVSSEVNVTNKTDVNNVSSSTAIDRKKIGLVKGDPHESGDKNLKTAVGSKDKLKRILPKIESSKLNEIEKASNDVVTKSASQQENKKVDMGFNKKYEPPPATIEERVKKMKISTNQLRDWALGNG
jgi:hypothetical protein